MSATLQVARLLCERDSLMRQVVTAALIAVATRAAEKLGERIGERAADRLAPAPTPDAPRRTL